MLITTPWQAQRIALEQIVQREASLMRDERERDWKHRKQEGEDWFAKEMAELEEWFAYLDRTHREQNQTGLSHEKIPARVPMSPPFKRYFAMLGDEAAGDDFCSEIAAVMMQIALVVSVQNTLGVCLGDHEMQLRRVVKRAGLPVGAGTTSSGSATAAAVVAPPRNTP